MTPAVATTALLAMASVSLWTLRVALTARNHKATAVVAASVEATVSVLAFSRILSSLDSVVQIAAYGIGVGCGTLVGLTVNDRLNPKRPSAEVTAEPADGPDTIPIESLLADDLRALIADWDVLDEWMSAEPQSSTEASSSVAPR